MMSSPHLILEDDLWRHVSGNAACAGAAAKAALPPGAAKTAQPDVPLGSMQQDAVQLYV